MRINYSNGFISYLLWIHLKKLSQFSETYILLMEYPYIRGKDLSDYAKNSTCNPLHAYIDAHS